MLHLWGSASSMQLYRPELAWGLGLVSVRRSYSSQHRKNNLCYVWRLHPMLVLLSFYHQFSDIMTAVTGFEIIADGPWSVSALRVLGLFKLSPPKRSPVVELEVVSTFLDTSTGPILSYPCFGPLSETVSSTNSRTSRTALDCSFSTRPFRRSMLDIFMDW